MPTSKTDDFNLYTDSFCGFLCKKCNFIQIDIENIRKHLRVEHEISDPSQYKKYYRKITLLPALKVLPFSPNPNVPHEHGKFNNLY